MWNRLLDARVLTLITLIGGGFGFYWRYMLHPDPQPVAPPPAQINFSPKITVENNPVNQVSVNVPVPAPAVAATPTASPPLKAVALKASPPKPAAPAVQFPVVRNAYMNVPVEMVEGFTVTVVAISGNSERMFVQLKSNLWEEHPRFQVGSPPFDLTVKGTLYHLQVASWAGSMVKLVLERS